MIERLTVKLLDNEITKHTSRDAAWYALTTRGYVPGEIALHLNAVTTADVAYRVRQYADRMRLPVPATCAPTRIRVPKPPPENWRQAFQSTVMRTGMVLTLTQPMLEMICAIADNVQWDRGKYFQLQGNAAPDSFLLTSAALAKRGLIMLKKVQIKGEPRWTLTPAGHAVVELLQATGVFRVADAALGKSASA